MNPISFRSETAGGIAYKNGIASRNETTGGVGEKEPTPDSEIKYQGLDKDIVCFRGYESYSDKHKTSAVGVLAGVSFTAAALIFGLGCAKKYKWIDKVGNKNVKNFLSKYGTEPSYKACQYIKTNMSEGYKNFKKLFTKNA